MANALAQSSISPHTDPNMVDAMAETLNELKLSPDQGHATDKSLKLSILERMPTEILSKVFLISRNPYLLQTNHKIQGRLSADVLLNELVLLAFGRSTTCENDSYYIKAGEMCHFCIHGVLAQHREASIDPGLLEVADNTEDYGDSDFCAHSTSSSSCHDGKGTNKNCVISIRDKRKLQSRILQSSWFSYRHVLLVENSCQTCVVKAAETYRTLKADIGFAPVCYEYGTEWGKHHHRRHIVHGVALPRRLLENPASDDDWKMLRKLLEWATDTSWSTSGCFRVRAKVMEAGKLAMRSAIQEGSLAALSLFFRSPHLTNLSCKSCMGSSPSTEELRRAIEHNLPKGIILYFLTSFDYGEIEAHLADVHYNALLCQAKKMRAENPKEHGYIYEALATLGDAVDHPREKYWGPEEQRTRELEMTDVEAHMNSELGSIYGLALKKMIREKEGDLFRNKRQVLLSIVSLWSLINA